MERLPLSSVRTFVVVARLLSFSRAADKLHVTPSAVSHQIRALEQYLGVPLFHRTKNALSLTSAGERYMVDASEALLLLTRATQAVRRTPQRQVLRIGAPPTLASLWLAPRLPSFQKAHPEIALTVTASADPPPLLRDSLHIALWYGDGAIPGFVVDPLGQNRIFPICSPALTQGEHALRSAADLKHHTVLDSSDETYYQDRGVKQIGWPEWLRAAGLQRVAGARDMNLSPGMLMHNAVKAGAGVGLSRSLVALDALVEREIAVPFGPAVPLTTTYNLAFPAEHGKRKDLAAFREWVMAEAQASTQQIERLLKRYVFDGAEPMPAA